MTPLDIRNTNFEALRSRLTGLRAVAFEGWVAHGPGTTREVAHRCGMDILTFRPRTTELMQDGFMEFVESRGTEFSKHEGVYRARTIEEHKAWHDSLREKLPVSTQEQLL